MKNIAEPNRVYSLEVGKPAVPKQVPTSTGTVAAREESAAPQPKARALSRPSALAAAAVIALLAAGGFAWHTALGPRLFGTSAVEDKLKEAPRLSIVVLPFENVSGDKEQDYFADAITGDLTTELSHLPDSFVIGHGTAETYKGK